MYFFVNDRPIFSFSQDDSLLSLFPVDQDYFGNFGISSLIGSPVSALRNATISVFSSLFNPRDFINALRFGFVPSP